MLFLNLIAYFFLFCSSLPQGVAAEPKADFDLRGLMHFALENSPEFRIYESNYKISVLKEKNDSHYLLPKLDLSASHGLRGTDPQSISSLGIEPWASSLSLTMSENIYDNGKSYKQYQISKLQQKLVASQFLLNKNKFCLNVVSQYLNFSLYHKMYSVQEAKNISIKKQFTLFSNDYHHGIRTQKDFLRLKTSVYRSELDLLSFKDSMARAQEQLMLTIGQNNMDKNGLALSVEAITPYNFTELPKDILEIQLISDNLPFMERFSIQRQVNDLQEALVENPYLPEINFAANMGYSNADYIGNKKYSFNETASKSWSAMITINWNLLDWGYQSNLKEIAIQNKMISNNQMEAERNQYLSDVQQVSTKYKIALENYKLAEELLKMENSNMLYIEREYRNGKVLYLDYSAGLRDLADAQSKFYASIMDLLNVAYTVKFHKGTLFDEILK